MKVFNSWTAVALLVATQTGRADPLDNWNQSKPLPVGASVYQAAYGNGQFVVVGRDGSILTSRDSISWVQRQSGTTISLSAIAFVNGQFVATGYDPIDWKGIIVTSADGTNWVQCRSGFNDGGWAIAYGDGQFVIAGLGGQPGTCGSPIQVSHDGTNWVQSAWGSHGNAIAYGNGQFVILGTSILTSTDALNWTDHQSEFSYQIFGLTYGGGQFVAVSDEEFNNGGNVDYLARILTSSDGVNWVKRFASNQYALLGISYAGGQFVAVGYTVPNGDDVIVTSGDGVNWVRRQLPQSGGLSGITFGNGRFVAVGNPILVSASITAPTESVQSTRVVNLWPGNLNVPANLTNIIAIAVPDRGYDRLALTKDQNVTYWGTSILVPHEMSNMVAIVSGFQNLELRSDGTVLVWTHDFQGDMSAPNGLSNVVAIAAGGAFSLALKSDGTVVGWGNLFPEPLVSDGLSNVVAIAAGYAHALALKADGTVVAWGLNNGGQTDVPNELTNVVRIAAGDHHSLALKADGTLIAWGIYGNRTLSAGEYVVNAIVPSGLTNVAAMIGGEYYTLALKEDGTLVQWGAVGQSVDYIPAGKASYQGIVIPAGLTNVFAISHGLALVGDQPPILGLLNATMTKPGLDAEGFHCSISSESGRVYRLEYKTSLTDPSWTALPLTAGNGGVITLNDPTAGGMERVYRVRRW